MTAARARVSSAFVQTAGMAPLAERDSEPPCRVLSHGTNPPVMLGGARPLPPCADIRTLR